MDCILQTGGMQRLQTGGLQKALLHSLVAPKGAGLWDLAKLEVFFLRFMPSSYTPIELSQTTILNIAKNITYWTMLRLSWNMT